MAVIRDGELLASSQITMGRGRDDLLTPAVTPLLVQTGIGIRELGGVVCGEGPGSFTSLRIAAAFAKGMAFGLNVPLFGVPSLALVSGSDDRPLSSGTYCVSTDALRDECYAQWIDVTSDHTITIAGGVERVLTRELERFAEGRELVLADASVDTHPRATMVRWLRDWRAPGAVNLDVWEPAYGRLAEAQVKWEATHGRTLG
jgi:tRNA threonylcarbamoyladenosine biosynthesis protein TsaB